MYESLSDAEAGSKQCWMVQVRGAISQLTVALSQGRASQTVTTWTERNPQQHACRQRTKGQRSSVSQLVRGVLEQWFLTSSSHNHQYDQSGAILFTGLSDHFKFFILCSIVPRWAFCLIFVSVCLACAIWILQIGRHSGRDVRTNRICRDNQSTWNKTKFKWKHTSTHTHK